MFLGYFFANKQLDKVCELELDTCCVGDIGVELFMRELSQGCMSEEAMGIDLALTGLDCSHLFVKFISETMSCTPKLWALHFMDWIQDEFDATAALTYLIEGLCKRSTRIKHITLEGCVSYKHAYYLALFIAYGNVQHLNLSTNDFGSSLVMSLLAQSSAM